MSQGNAFSNAWAQQNAATIGSVHTGRPPWIKVPAGGIPHSVLGRIEPREFVDLLSYFGVQDTVRMLSNSLLE